ncbi:MAG TPA: RNB domain-containing ribonuclease [Kofleriaceae bacterium]|nr:RNB domain-containing ribonuclease [Kofleriaceae bacterium]
MSRDQGRSQLRRIARRAMVERGLLPGFSREALAEADRLAPETDGSARDMRELLWASIDNDDSRDLDQLSVAESLAGGAARVLVAIADVDAGAPKGSAIDEHARTNTTSVYTAAEIFPMIPERLSTDLTSLGEGEERLAVVVAMTVDAGGEVTEADIQRALVRNHARLTYDGVAAWLEGGAAPARLAAVPGMDDQIRMQDRAAQAMKRLRHERGALRVETTEARAVFDGDALADMRRVEKNRAKELIEDLMIAANGATARYLEARGFPSLRRVLRAPRRWDRIAELAAELGEKLPAEPDPVALDAFLARRRAVAPERFADLSVSVVKLLGSGEYALELPGQESEGHFGLSARDYTHSTAPNRRFPDLATQRLLKAAIDGRPVPYSNEELDALARHCTVQEDAAAKVERQVRKSAGALLLSSRIGEEFDAIVTGASEKGTWVRVLPPGPAVDGKVTRGADGLDVGDRTRVELVRTDVERGFIDFARAR